jgi:hypothetical protein
MFFMPWACSGFRFNKTHGTESVPWLPAFASGHDFSRAVQPSKHGGFSR